MANRRWKWRVWPLASVDVRHAPQTVNQGSISERTDPGWTSTEHVGIAAHGTLVFWPRGKPSFGWQRGVEYRQVLNPLVTIDELLRLATELATRHGIAPP